jgi:disulfide bond formation protein DsbB
MLERSWYLYQLENGIGEGSCQFFLGFPEWFALDQWFPFLFEVRNLCGYTPELLFGISMAEGLIAAAVGLLLAAGLALWSLLRGPAAAR